MKEKYEQNSHFKLREAGEFVVISRRFVGATRKCRQNESFLSPDFRDATFALESNEVRLFIN